MYRNNVSEQRLGFDAVPPPKQRTPEMAQRVLEAESLRAHRQRLRECKQRNPLHDMSLHWNLRFRAPRAGRAAAR